MIVQSGPCAEAASVPVSVTVEPVPTVVITNNKPTTICKGDAVTMVVDVDDVTNGGAGSDWTLNYTVNGTSFTSNGSGNASSHRVDLGNIEVGSTVRLVSLVTRGTNGMKCDNLSLTDQFTIIVNDNPTVTISDHTDSICTGSTADVDVVVDNVKVGENWTITYSMSNESSNRTFSGSGPGSFVFTTPTQTNSGTTHTTVDVSIVRIVNNSITPSCSNDSVRTVTVVVSPETNGGTLTPTSREVCEGDNSGVISLSGHVGDVKWWEYSTDGGNTWTTTSNNGTTLNYNNITQTTWYRVWVQSSPCAGRYSSLSRITVLPKPEATISGSPRVCPNEPAVFNLTVSNVPAGQGWTLTFDENGTTRTLSGVGSGVFNLTTNGYPYTTTPSTIIVTLTSIENTTSGCRNTELNSTVSAVITPNPDVAFDVRNTCQDTAVTFTNRSNIVEGTISSYKWFFGNGDSSNATNPVYKYANAGTYTIRLIATSDNGCTGEVSQTIEVFEVPDVDFNIDNVCQNEDLNVDGVINNGVAIASWEWNFGDDNSANTQNASNRYAAAGNYNVTLTVTSTNGCTQSVTKEVVIYVLPNPSFTADPVCENTEALFANTSSIPYGSMTYDWDFAGQGGSTATNPRFTFTGNGEFDVQLKATSNFGCQDSITIPITIYPEPVADFDVDEVCIGETSVFVDNSTVSTGSIIERFWDFGDNSYSTGENPTKTYGAPNETGYNVTLRVVSDRGCEHTTTGNAIVWPLPDVSISADNDAFCDGDSMELIASSSAPGSVTFFWSTDPRVNGDRITVTTGGWFTVVATADPSRGGCINSDSILITVWSNPIADAGEDQTINKGEDAQLEGSGGVFYNWSPLTYLDDPNSDRPIAQSMMETVRYVLTVTDDNGCTDSDTVLITVVEEFVLVPYNVVTPNGDGQNDTWIIDNIQAYPDAEVVIFNRYGMEVYSTTNYHLNEWDGTRNGNELPDGAYYYVITSEDHDKVWKGSINLIRTSNR